MEDEKDRSLTLQQQERMQELRKQVKKIKESMYKEFLECLRSSSASQFGSSSIPSNKDKDRDNA